MKKIILILSMIMVLLTGSLSFATNDVADSTENFEYSATNEAVVEKEEMTPASEKILENMTTKERKIAEYSDKFNDKNLGTIAYYLDVIQLYSIPVCIIGLIWGAFNFYIIGEKKLDKREQGFSFIVSFLCGFVAFQVLPLVFALLVAGK